MTFTAHDLHILAASTTPLPRTLRKLTPNSTSEQQTACTRPRKPLGRSRGTRARRSRNTRCTQAAADHKETRLGVRQGASRAGRGCNLARRRRRAVSRMEADDRIGCPRQLEAQCCSAPVLPQPSAKDIARCSTPVDIWNCTNTLRQTIKNFVVKKLKPSQSQNLLKTHWHSPNLITAASLLVHQNQT